MDPTKPPGSTRADLSTLAAELHSLRDLLVTLSLQLTDMQFESDPGMRTEAISQTDQLLRACQAHLA
jgi:hypothetical protein